MKMKLKLDQEQLQALALAHGEKAGLGLAALLFLGIVWSAIQIAGYDKKPADLVQSTVAAKTHLENLPWDARAQQPPVVIPNPPYADQVAAANKPVDAAQFRITTAWNTPLRDLRVRRDEPSYLALAAPQVAYHYGAIAQKGKSYQGYKWVVVTAAVPFGEQLAAYKKMFDNALFTSPTLDVPSYHSYVIERAEVVPGQAEDSLQWKPLDVDAAFTLAADTFAEKKPEVVAKKFVDPALTEVCPPVVGLALDATAAHPPEIEFSLQAENPEAAAAVAAAAAPADAGDGAKKKRPTGGAKADAPPAAGQAAAAAAPKVAEVVPHRLFRFFDYTVEHERSYRYRVKLLLNNPNKGVVVRFLKKPELADGDTRETAFSPPSAPVSVPRDFYLVAGRVDQPRTAVKEPLAGVLIVRWTPAAGADVSHLFPKERGTLLDFPGTQAVIPVPGRPGATSPGTVDFITHSMLVDMFGGDPTLNAKNKPIRGPGEFLVMGPHGELTIHQSIADGAKFEAEYRAGGGAAAANLDQPAGDDAAPAPAPAAGNALDDLFKLPAGKKK